MLGFGFVIAVRYDIPAVVISAEDICRVLVLHSSSCLKYGRDREFEALLVRMTIPLRSDCSRSYIIVLFWIGIVDGDEFVKTIDSLQSYNKHLKNYLIA